MSTTRPLRVLVAGGGFAAAEALLALRAFAEDRVALELVTPDTRLPFRPASTAAAYTAEDVVTYDLAELAGSVGATVRDDVAEAVAPAVREVRMRSGAHVPYDALVLAVGARARVGIPGAVTFRDQRDAAAMAQVVDELRTGEAASVVFAAPAGVVWTVPLYELALHAAAEVQRRGLESTITVVTPECEPLEVFGDAASAALSAALDAREIRVVTATRPESVDRSGLRLAFGGTVPADRVVAIPALTGRRLPGVPSHDFSGFVATDEHGRVEGLDAVWAAGDMTASPVKQGGLAAQQAERAAAHIAALAGAGAPRPLRPLVLRTRISGTPEPLYLRAELDARGIAVESSSVALDEPPWWPDAKVVGRHLTPWMAERARYVVALTP